jgi:RNA polymerase sigma-70 factor (ECF subfamily)
MMPWSVENARDHLRLVARLLWKPGVQRELDLSDIVQQTLLKGHAKAHQFRGHTEAEWRGWLRAILKNELIKFVENNPSDLQSLNESSQRLEDSLAGDQTSPSQRAIRHEELERLAVALGKLLEDERTAVELKYLRGCSVEDISQRIGRTKEAVGGVLKRGLRKLRQHLHAEGAKEQV